MVRKNSNHFSEWTAESIFYCNIRNYGTGFVNFRPDFKFLITFAISHSVFSGTEGKGLHLLPKLKTFLEIQSNLLFYSTVRNLSNLKHVNHYHYDDDDDDDEVDDDDDTDDRRTTTAVSVKHSLNTGKYLH